MAAGGHGTAGAGIELSIGLLTDAGLVPGIPVVLHGLLQLSVEVVEEVVEGGGHREGELSGGPKMGNAVHGDGRSGGRGDVPGAESLAQGGGLGWGDSCGSRHADFAQVLGLHAQIAAAHAHAVTFDEERAEVAQQQAAQHFEVPRVRGDEVQVVVGVGLPAVKNWEEGVLDVGDVKLVAAVELLVNFVNGPVPARGILFGHVTTGEPSAMRRQVGLQAGPQRQVHELTVVPWRDEPLAAPREVAGAHVGGAGQAQLMGGLDLIGIGGEKHRIGSGGHSDAHARARHV